MADTRRTLSALQTLLADNTTGDISAQDARDVLISEHPEKIIQSGSFGSIPASGQLTGDLYLPTDGHSGYRWDGSLWVPHGPVMPFTEPALQTFSWVNQGSATVSTTNGGIVLSAPSNGTAHSCRIRKKSAPSTPYTITAAFLPNMGGSTYSAWGFGFRAGGSGSLHFYYFEWNSGQVVYSYKWSNATTPGASYQSATNYMFSGPVVWLRIADNGTNRILSTSMDGQTWLPWHTVGRTDYITADEVIFYVNPYAGAADLTLLSWKEA